MRRSRGVSSPRTNRCARSWLSALSEVARHKARGDADREGGLLHRCGFAPRGQTLFASGPSRTAVMGIAALYHPTCWAAERRAGLSRAALDHTEPAEALIRLVTGRGVEGDQRAGAVLREAKAPSLQWKRDAFGEQALAVGRCDHPEIRIDQQHARLVGGADAHALDDGAGLRFPIEMDRQHADRFGIRLAAFANAGAIGHDLGVAEQGLAFDVADGVVVAGSQAPGGL